MWKLTSSKRNELKDQWEEMFLSSPSISIESPTGHGTVVATMGQSEIAQMMPSRSSASLDHGAWVRAEIDEIVIWSLQNVNLVFWTMIPLSYRFANLIESDEVFFLHRLTGQVWPNTRHLHPAAVGGFGQDTGDFSGGHCQLGRCVGSTVPPKQKGVSNSISLNFATIHESVYQTFG